jgi:hypothetical protein
MAGISFAPFVGDAVGELLSQAVNMPKRNPITKIIDNLFISHPFSSSNSIY